jgi:hypothetical protein
MVDKVRKSLYLDLGGISTAVTVDPRASLLTAVVVNSTLSAHDVELQDNDVMVFKIPASSVAGSTFKFFDTKFNTNLKCISDAAATGIITIITTPLNQAGNIV